MNKVTTSIASCKPYIVTLLPSVRIMKVAFAKSSIHYFLIPATTIMWSIIVNTCFSIAACVYMIHYGCRWNIYDIDMCVCIYVCCVCVCVCVRMQGAAEGVEVCESFLSADTIGIRVHRCQPQGRVRTSTLHIPLCYSLSYICSYLSI